METKSFGGQSSKFHQSIIARKLISCLIVILISLNAIPLTSARKVIQVDAKENVTLVITNTTLINSTIKTTNNGAYLNSVPASNTKSLSNPPTTLSKFSPFFGMEFAPYVRSDGFPRASYPLEEIKKMLRVILTKGHSILTYEMGYPDENYNGPYDTTSASLIALAAAHFNTEANFLTVSVSQGAGILSSYKVTHQPDIEAALFSAEQANSIHPHTVWSITFSPGYTSDYGNGHVIDAETGRVAITEIQKYARRVHERNLKVGVWVDLCGEILTGDKDRPIRRMLSSLASITDYFICSVYPTVAISEPGDYFNAVKSQFEMIKFAWKRAAPHLQIILQTGWASEGQSNSNPAYFNSAKKSKEFWDLMQKWAETTKQRVYMHEAFDVTEDADAHSGYWKRASDNSDNYVEKGTGHVVTF